MVGKIDEAHFEKFYAAIVSDMQKLDALIQSQEDMKITLHYKSNWNNEDKTLQFSVMDILEMSMDAWYLDKEKTELIWEDVKKFSPKIFYQKTLDCFVFMRNKFPNYNHKPISYFEISDSIYGQWDVIDEDDEIPKLLKLGYRRIDIELLNSVWNYDIERLRKCLEQGANPAVEIPDDVDNLNSGDTCDVHSMSHDNPMLWISAAKTVLDLEIQNYDMKVCQEYSFYDFENLYKIASIGKIERVITEEFGKK